jgi:hypothetical protein
LLVAVVAGILAPAAVAAPASFDRTLSCDRPAGPVVSLEAHSSFTLGANSTSPASFPAVAALFNSTDQPYGSVTASAHGYGFSGKACAKKAAAIPLTPAGLRLVGDFKSGDTGLGVTNYPAHCVVGKRVVVRIHAALGDGDVPTSGSLAMRAGGAKLRPLVFVAWTPQRVRVYLAASCNS